MILFNLPFLVVTTLFFGIFFHPFFCIYTLYIQIQSHKGKPLFSMVLTLFSFFSLFFIRSVNRINLYIYKDKVSSVYNLNINRYSTFWNCFCIYRAYIRFFESHLNRLYAKLIFNSFDSIFHKI